MSDIVKTSPNDTLSTEVKREVPNPALVYLAGLGSAKSRRAAGDALKRILRVLRADVDPGGFPWQSLKYEHCQLIRTQLAASCAPATANLSLAALRGCLLAAWRLELMSTDDYHRAKDVRAVRGHREPKGRHVSMGEIRQLFDGCAMIGAKNPWLAARNAALVALLFGAGLRRAEVVDMNVGDLDLETGRVKVLGKGNKERTTYLPEGSMDAVRAWMVVRGPHLSSDPMLLSGKRGCNKRRISEGGVLFGLNQAAKRANVKTFSPHDLRRTFIGELLEAGSDISSIQKMVGHASPTTTSRYDRRDDKAKKRASTLLHVPYHLVKETES